MAARDGELTTEAGDSECCELKDMVESCDRSGGCGIGIGGEFLSKRCPETTDVEVAGVPDHCGATGIESIWVEGCLTCRRGKAPLETSVGIREEPVSK